MIDLQITLLSWLLYYKDFHHYHALSHQHNEKYGKKYVANAPQNAGNRISEGLSFKLFRGRIPVDTPDFGGGPWK